MAILVIAKNVTERYDLGNDEWVELIFRPPDYWDRAKFGLRLANIVDLEKLAVLQTEAEKTPDEEIDDSRFLETIRDVDATIDGIKQQLEATVIDWKNVYGEDGNLMPFSFNGLTSLLSAYPHILSKVADTLNTVMMPSEVSQAK